MSIQQPEIPKDKVAWLNDYRAGKIDNVYGDFKCPVAEECVCNFGSLADVLMHVESGRHGTLGDRFSEEKRREFKYFSRQMRYKERKYRVQNDETAQESSQETLK